MDWDKIKQEYVTNNISYRKLAEKHNVPFTTLRHQAKVGEWHSARTQYRDRVMTKSLEKAESNATEYKSTLYELAYKVAKQLNDMTDQYTVSELSGIGIKPRDLTGAIKDLEDVLHVKSEADIREQEARIEKLRKEAQDEREAKDIKIIFEKELDNYSI